jgi:neuropeptide Y receptor
VSLPVALQSGLEEWGEPSLNLVRCGEIHWRDAQQKSVYSSTIMVLQYFVPLWVLLITYTHIGFVVWLKKTPGEAESSRDQRMMTSKRKVSDLDLDLNCYYYYYYNKNNSIKDSKIAISA